MSQFDVVTTQLRGQPLHGLCWRTRGRKKGTAIQVHGTWGNFYGNGFATSLASTYANLGYDYFTLNFPGHDETAVREQFELFSDGLTVWLEHPSMASPGSFVLQGHSLGALKVLALLRGALPLNEKLREVTTRLDQAILLSPFDVVEFYGRGEGREPASTRAVLSSLVAQGCGSDLVPKDLFDAWDISVATMHNALVAGGVWDQFPSRSGPSGLQSLSREPVTILLGSEDFASYPSATSVLSMLEAVGANVHMVQGAPHGFGGYEDKLAEIVKGCLEGI